MLYPVIPAVIPCFERKIGLALAESLVTKGNIGDIRQATPLLTQARMFIY